MLSDTPAALRPPEPSPSLPFSRVDEELRTLLCSLPSKADIEAIAGHLEATHQREVKAVRTEVQVTARVSAGETALTTMDKRLAELEAAQRSHMEATIAMQLHMEDLEDRSRRNNVRIKGLPEATGSEDLPETVSAIIAQLLEDSLPANLRV